MSEEKEISLTDYLAGFNTIKIKIGEKIVDTTKKQKEKINEVIERRKRVSKKRLDKDEQTFRSKDLPEEMPGKMRYRSNKQTTLLRKIRDGGFFILTRDKKEYKRLREGDSKKMEIICLCIPTNKEIILYELLEVKPVEKEI